MESVHLANLIGFCAFLLTCLIGWGLSCWSAVRIAEAPYKYEDSVEDDDDDFDEEEDEQT